MKVEMYFLSLSLLLISSMVTACPMKIVNDGSTPIFVSDMHSRNALLLPAGKSGMINPTVKGFKRLYTKEKLRFYVPVTNKQKYYASYEMTESYCSDEVPTIKLSDVKKWVDTPSKRFSATFYKHEKGAAHNHDHGHAH